jgi:branched-chain amino acid transport system permease protein
MVNNARIKKYAIYSGPLLVLLVVPTFVTNPYHMHILITIGIWIILSLSLHLVISCGILTLGHAAFMGIGAYISAVLATKLGFSFWLALPTSMVGVAIIALLLGYVTLRTRWIYFALITLAFCEVTRLAIASIPGIGAWEGLSGIPNPSIAGITFSGKVPYYYLILIFVLLTTVIINRLELPRFGRILHDIRENHILAESTGVNLIRYQVVVFSIGSMFAGLAGCLQAHYVMFICPNDFTIWKSVYAILFIVIGGIGSIWGPIIGTFVLTVIPEFLRVTAQWEPLIYAIIVLVFILALPEGLISLPRRLRAYAKNNMRRRS